MKRSFIALSLAFLLSLAAGSAYSQKIESADIFITPNANPSAFNGYFGGDGNAASGLDNWIDWSIGNNVIFSGVVSDDMVFSTNIGDFSNGSDWFERMRITKQGDVGIGISNPWAKLTVADRLVVAGVGGELTFFTIGDAVDITSRDTDLFINNNQNGNVLITTGTSTGRVGIGTAGLPQGKLDVNGTIFQRGVLLHADYVFEPEYQLETIEEHAEYMWKHKHLKAVPPVSVDQDGQEVIEVGAHRRGIVEELEKAHIYIEHLRQQIKALEERLNRLEGSR